MPSVCAGRVTRYLLPLLVLLMAVWVPPVCGQRGARVVQRNLAELVDEAAIILRGRVLSAQVEPHPQFNNLKTLVVTLRPLDVMKGQVPAEFTFRQFIPDPRDQRSRLGYKPGQEVVLLMIQPSQYGLSSPAGLDQGRFRVFEDAQGNRHVVNGLNNMGLFRQISRAAPSLSSQASAQARRVLTDHRGGPLGYAEFRELVRAVAAGKR